MTSALSSQPGRLPRSARRAQLLEVAREVFVEQGYHSASMDEIAERAGVSKPVLYQHFGGKFDLYLALLGQSCAEVTEGVRTALASTHDNSRRVEATIRLWFDFVSDQSAAFRLVFESDLMSDPEVRALVDAVTNDSTEAIAEVIAEDTGLADDAARMLAVGLVGMGHIGAQNWLSTGSGLSKDDAVRLMAGLAWRGIGGFPQHSTTQHSMTQHSTTQHSTTQHPQGEN